MTLDEFIRIATAIHGGKYTYEKVSFKNLTDFITIHCPEHGYFDQRVRYHIKAKKGQKPCGCPKCGKKYRTHPHKKNTEKFIAESKSLYADRYDYDYSKVEYINAQTNVIIICREHNREFSVKPYAHLHQNEKCRDCGYRDRQMPNQKTTEQFIKQAKKKWGEKYNYSDTVYVNKHTKIKYECKNGHGVIEQLPTLHLKNGCPYCNGRGISRHNLASYVAIAKVIHKDKYDYSKTHFVRMSDAITITCPKHGDFAQRAGNHIHLENGCPKCVPGSSSKEEKDLLEFIKKYYHGIIIENDRNALDGKEIDIFIPELSLGIEYHGIYWHLETVHGKYYHYNKWKLAKERGIWLIQIYSTEWDQKRLILESKIANLFGASEKIMARKTQVVEVGRAEKDQFLTENHLQGSDSSKIWFGLECEGKLVSVMTFGSSRFNKRYDYELVRYCNKRGITVTGGASKLLKYFERNHIGSVVTYADKRYSEGGMYEAIGFKLDGETAPSFSYFNIKNNQIFNRMKFQKQFLKDMPGYSPDLTEYEIMQLSGYDRIWDAGQYRYVKLLVPDLGFE